MPSIPDILQQKPRIKEKPLPQAYWVEYHYVYSKGDWEAGSTALVKAFPRDALASRGAEWYQWLLPTHGPGKLPPGNAPFFLAEWVLHKYVEEHSERRGDLGYEALGKEYEEALKKAGFERVVAHVCVLPPDSDYLICAMRSVEGYAWNVDPQRSRCYLYPSLQKFAKKPLRDFNTTPWRY